METAEDTSSKPMARDSGFHSGFARAAILRKEEELLEPLGARDDGNRREMRERFGGMGEGGVAGVGCVELNLLVGHLDRRLVLKSLLPWLKMCTLGTKW